MNMKNMTTTELLERKQELELILKPEETDDLIRIPAKGEEGKHKGHKIRWITVSAKEGIRGIYCIDCKKIITYVFDKKKGWDMEKAKAWMAEHGKAVGDYFEEIERDVIDNKDMDWDVDVEKLKASIEKDEKEEKLKDIGLFDIKELAEIVNRNKELVIEKDRLKEKLKDIELKAGAALNAKNKKDLKNAQALIQSVLDSATTGEEEDSLEITDEKGEDDKTDNTVIDLVIDTVDDPLLDKKEDEDKIEVDEKVIAKTIEKHMNYLVGKLDKSDT